MEKNQEIENSSNLLEKQEKFEAGDEASEQSSNRNQDLRAFVAFISSYPSKIAENLANRPFSVESV